MDIIWKIITEDLGMSEKYNIYTPIFKMVGYR